MLLHGERRILYKVLACSPHNTDVVDGYANVACTNAIHHWQTSYILVARNMADEASFRRHLLFHPTPTHIAVTYTPNIRTICVYGVPQHATLLCIFAIIIFGSKSHVNATGTTEAKCQRSSNTPISFAPVARFSFNSTTRVINHLEIHQLIASMMKANAFHEIKCRISLL